MEGSLDQVVWPSTTSIRASLSPLDVFGVPTKNRPRTLLVRAAPDVQIFFNSNNGRTEVESSIFLSPLSYKQMFSNKINISFDKNLLVIQSEVVSLEDLKSILIFIEYHLPAYFSIEMSTYITVEEIVGEIGSNFKFRYELNEFKAIIFTSTEKRRKNHIDEALTFSQLTTPSAARFVLACIYYQQALRFLSPLESKIPSLNMAEVLLNLAKCLEILFGNRDGVRKACKMLGYNSEQIESQIIPLLLGRNELDIAHAVGSRIPYECIDILLNYGNRALLNVRSVLIRTGRALGQNEDILMPLKLKKEKIKLLKDFQNYLEKPGLPLES